MPVIITLVIAMLLILVSWSWHNLGNVGKTKKALTIVVSLIILYLITFILFNIAKQGVPYNSEEQMKSVRIVLVLTFTIINGLIIMPSVFKQINKVNEKAIDRDQATKKVLIIILIFFVIMIFECIYLKNIQNEILNIYLKAIQK